MIKHEVIKRIVTSQVNYPDYTLYIDRVLITLQPRRTPGYQQVRHYPRVDDGAFTLTELAISLPETVYSDETLGHKIVEARDSDVREFIASQLLTWYKCSSADKRGILLNLKPGINTTEQLFKKSLDLLAERNKVFPFYLDFHLMSLEDLLNLFSDSGDDHAKAKAKLLTLCI